MPTMIDRIVKKLFCKILSSAGALSHLDFSPRMAGACLCL